MTVPLLTFRAIRSTAVEVPTTYALGTSRGVITKAPLLLIDLETEEGITGRSYVWSYFPAAAHAIAKMLEEVARVVSGERLAPRSRVGQGGGAEISNSLSRGLTSSPTRPAPSCRGEWRRNSCTCAPFGRRRMHRR